MVFSTSTQKTRGFFGFPLWGRVETNPITPKLWYPTCCEPTSKFIQIQHLKRLRIPDTASKWNWYKSKPEEHPNVDSILLAVSCYPNILNDIWLQFSEFLQVGSFLSAASHVKLSIVWKAHLRSYPLLPCPELLMSRCPPNSLESIANISVSCLDLLKGV